MSIATRYAYVKSQVVAVARECGRNPEEIKLIAVSKTTDTSGVACALEAGACDFGENRPDSLCEKAKVHPQASWHFIGNIQSRRISDIAIHASMVHSLYQAHHIPIFERTAAATGKTLDMLIEVNVSGEASKSGCIPADALALAQEVSAQSHLRIRGLMTMAPQGDLTCACECFSDLARLADTVRTSLDATAQASFNELSMGMSEDWREAIRCGATMIRIGRAIFDEAFEPPVNSD